MKNFQKIIAMAISLVVLSFIGCNNLSDNSVSNNDKSVRAAETKLITISAESDDGLVIFGEEDNDSRTIIPAAVSASTLKFYLVYTDLINSSTTSTLEEVRFNRDTTATTYTKGSITKSFALSDFKFTLYALTSAQVAKAGTVSATNVASFASYVGYANADLRYYDDVSFHLRPNSSAEGKGRLDLTINNAVVSGSTRWTVPEGYYVTAGLYDVDTDALVYPASEAKTILAAADTPAAVNGATLANAADSYDIYAGEYNLIIKYVNNTLGKSYEYNEKVVILMNEQTVGTINVPDILGKAPDTPSEFTVQYKNPKTTDIEYYPVKFNWTDNARTERQFKLQLLEITSSGDYFSFPASDAAWTTVSSSGTSVTYTKLTMQNSQYLIEGTLNKNSSSVTMYLPLGKRYVARLCASNDAGDSAWAYVNWIGTAESGWETYPVAETTGTEYVTTINRFRVTYDLNGGKFYNSAESATLLTASTTPKVPALVHYASQYTTVTITSGAVSASAAPTTKNAILSPDGLTEQTWITDLAGKTPITDAAKITLAAGANYFDKWLKDSDSGSAYTQSVTYENSPTTFIQNIKYYPNNVTSDTEAANTALGSQPIATGFNGTYDHDGEASTDPVAYHVRKAVSAVYTGYTNLTLVAHYDTTKVLYVELEDPHLYELQASWIKTAFQKDSTAVTGNIDYADSVAAASITDLSTFTNGLLEVSIGKINQIVFTVSDADAHFPVTTYNEASNTITSADGTYDKIHLKVQKIGDKKVLVDTDLTGTASKSVTVGFKTWTDGKYQLIFTAVTSEMPTITYSQTAILEITQ